METDVNETGQRGATRTPMLASLRDADDVWGRFPVVADRRTNGFDPSGITGSQANR